MTAIQKRFDGHETIIDEIHRLFGELERDPAAIALDLFSLQVLKLAIHEWVANLVQHADFAGEEPCIELVLIPEGEQLRCVIDDNSVGFDFAHQVARQQYLLDIAPEPPDRGRGLLMMVACTHKLSYAPLDHYLSRGDGFPSDLTFRLEFWVAPHDLDSQGRHRDRERQIPFQTELGLTAQSSHSAS